MPEIRLAPDQMQEIKRCILAAAFASRDNGRVDCKAAWEDAIHMLKHEPRLIFPDTDVNLLAQNAALTEEIGRLSERLREKDKHIAELEGLIPKKQVEVHLVNRDNQWYIHPCDQFVYIARRSRKEMLDLCADFGLKVVD